MDGVFGRLPPSSVNYINLSSFNMDCINPEVLQYGGMFLFNLTRK